MLLWWIVSATNCSQSGPLSHNNSTFNIYYMLYKQRILPKVSATGNVNSGQSEELHHQAPTMFETNDQATIKYFVPWNNKLQTICCWLMRKKTQPKPCWWYNISGKSDTLCMGSALCSPGPMFPGSYIPRSYIPRYLCSPVLSSPVPIFPGSYVPPNLTSPMFPGSYVPQYLCSPRNNITHPMFPGPYAPRVLCSPWAIDIISLPLKV